MSKGGLLQALRRLFAGQSGQREPAPPHVVGLQVQKDVVALRLSDGHEEDLSLAEMQAVSVLTTGDGPFAPDLFFVLEGPWGRRVISGELDDCEQLFDWFDHLPDFDHDRLLLAMGSTHNAVFPCWQAPITPQEAPA